MPFRAFITGCAGLGLTEAERAFLRASRPCGVILFKRNCGTPDQARRLIADCREAIGSADALVLIDQEGGRVQRLGPPHWRAYPPARTFGSMYAADPSLGMEAARACAHLMALELSALGITVDCAPVLDVPAAGAHDVIGDRAFSDDPDVVAALGRAVADGLMDGGVLPVVKHMPGHGRAGADSHVSLPVIDASPEALEAVDYLPFRALRDLPLAMTAHVLIRALDPERPATASPAIMREVIRGTIGFDGLVMSDDVSMGALSGSMRARTEAMFAAGVDVALHCNGDLAEMEAVAGAAPRLEGRAAERFAAALARLAPPLPCPAREAERLMAEAFAAVGAEA